MARILVLADIHANKPALDAVMQDAQKQGFGSAICLGDIVGYYFWPEECIVFAKSCQKVLQGNHDFAVAYDDIPERYSEGARAAFEWNIRNVSEKSKEYLKSLPDKAIFLGERVMLCHGSPLRNHLYILSMDDVLDEIPLIKENFPGIRLVLCGHTHVPMYFDEGCHNRLKIGVKHYDLDPGILSYINPGSVGQPRDKGSIDPMPVGKGDRGLAQYGILDTEGFSFDFHEVTYPLWPLEQKRQEIEKSGIMMPYALVRRLRIEF